MSLLVSNTKSGLQDTTFIRKIGRMKTLFLLCFLHTCNTVRSMSKMRCEIEIQWIGNQYYRLLVR